MPLNQPRVFLWTGISGMHWDGVVGSPYVCRAGEGEANPSSVTLPGWFVKTWGSILTLPWPAKLLLTVYLSHAEPVPPASSLCPTKLLLLLVCANMHHL